MSINDDHDTRTGFQRWAPAVFVAAVAFALLAATAAGIGALLSNADPEPHTEETVAEIPVPPPDVSVEEEVDDRNPFGHSQNEDEVTELLAQQYMLGMARQKIITDFVKTRYEMTPERILWLRQLVEAHSEFASQNTLLGILDRWESGDLSQAVEDHNTVWNLMDGEIGEASRIATQDEEARFIVTYYR